MLKHNFKNLHIWSDAMDFCDHIYEFTDTLPLRERYNLVSQLERCGVSIPSNIAEGSSKRTNNHFIEFLTTSLGSTFEVETQLLICARHGFGDQKIRAKLLNDVEKLQKKIHNFRESLGG